MNADSRDRKRRSGESHWHSELLLRDLGALSEDVGKGEKPSEESLRAFGTALLSFPERPMTESEIEAVGALWREEERRKERIRRRIITTGIAASVLVSVLGITAKLIPSRFEGDTTHTGNVEHPSDGQAESVGGDRGHDPPLTGTGQGSDSSLHQDREALSEEDLSRARIQEVARPLAGAEHDLTLAFLRGHLEIGTLGLSPSPKNGALFLRIVRDEQTEADVRAAASEALEVFPTEQEGLARFLIAIDDAGSLVDLMAGLPSGSAVNQSTEATVRLMFGLIDHSSFLVRRASTARLHRYEDPEGLLGRIYRERVSTELDLSTLEHMIGSTALSRLAKEQGKIPEKIEEIARGLNLRGDWECDEGRRTRAHAWKLLAYTDQKSASTLVLEILKTDRVLSRHLMIVLLDEVELLRKVVETNWQEVYGTIGQLLHDLDIESHRAFVALLNADGARAIARLESLPGGMGRPEVTIAQLLLCEDELLRGPLEVLERHLLQWLEGRELHAGEELAGVCHLLARIGPGATKDVLRRVAGDPQHSELARKQLFLAWLQASAPDGIPRDGSGSSSIEKGIEGIWESLRSSDSEEVLAVLSGLNPLPMALRRPEAIDLLVALVENPPANLPVFPFVAIPILYHLRQDGMSVDHDLQALSVPFLDHEDARVRLATALARFDGKDGGIGEIETALDSAGRVLDLTPVDSLTDETIGELRREIERIRPYRLRWVLSGEPDPEKARQKRDRLRGRLEERMARLEESRRSARFVLLEIFEALPSSALFEPAVALALRLRDPELRATLRRYRNRMTDRARKGAVDAALEAFEGLPDGLGSQLDGFPRLRASLERTELMKDLEEASRDLIVALRGE